ncbi:hypothetical protein CMEL01_15934 [Colletotrichum melonis]|uniref:Transposase n=1 Tax=Colletotrichum melonis TaxID=1209925 RepID=A0AAI9XRE0_9PEZI|nr:hypothetical protein CMEL01_15934 [Colletotrichum melonis]
MALKPLKREFDLTDDQKKIPEKWIKDLATCNRMRDVDATDIRRKIWGRVFDHWNTNKKVPQPSKAPMRRIAASTVHIGTLTQDAPLAHKRNWKRPTVVPKQRRADSRLTHIWLCIDGWKGTQMAYLAYQQQGPVVGGIHVFSRFNFTAAAYLADSFCDDTSGPQRE